MSKLKQTILLLIAFALPPATMVFYGWAYHEFGFGNSKVAGWLMLLVPTLIGATIVTVMPWPRATKIAMVIGYASVMMAIVVFTGIMVSCSYGDCL